MSRHEVLAVTHDEPRRMVYARVKSYRSGLEYLITSWASGDHCGCPAGIHGRACDHLDAVREYLTEQEAAARSSLKSLRLLASVVPTPALRAVPAPTAAPSPVRPSVPAPLRVEDLVPDNGVDHAIAAYDFSAGAHPRERMRRAIWEFLAWRARQEAREERNARLAASGLVGDVREARR